MKQNLGYCCQSFGFSSMKSYIETHVHSCLRLLLKLHTCLKICLVILLKLLACVPVLCNLWRSGNLEDANRTKIISSFDFEINSYQLDWSNQFKRSYNEVLTLWTNFKNITMTTNFIFKPIVIVLENLVSFRFWLHLGRLFL